MHTQRILCTSIITRRTMEGITAGNGWTKVLFEYLDGVSEEERHISAAYKFRDWLQIHAPFGDKDIWKGELLTARLFNAQYVHILLPIKGKRKCKKSKD